MNIFKTINELGKKAKDASIKIRVLEKEKKMAAYQFLEKNIEKNADLILSANKLDIENAITNNLSKPLINRLKVTEESISGIIKSITEIKNPNGEMLGSEGFQNYIKQYQSTPNNERLRIMIDDILNKGHIQKDDLTIVVIDSK